MVAIEDHIGGVFIQIAGEVVQIRGKQPIRAGIGTRILKEKPKNIICIAKMHFLKDMGDVF